jgi:hypothetical protein
MMNSKQVLWEKGEFTRIVATMLKTSGEQIKEPGLTKDISWWTLVRVMTLTSNQRQDCG